MNCDEAEELLGACALDALPDDEAAAMRAHLAGCDKHTARVAEFRAAALELSALADTIEAPPLLRARVLDAVAAEAARTRSPAPTSIHDTSRGRVAWGLADGRRAATYRWGALAAALIVALGGMLAWNLVLMNRGGSSVDQFASRATSIATLKQPAGDAAGTVVYFDGEKKAFVSLENLPQLDATKNVYEMWSMNGTESKSIGLMQSAGSRTTVVVPFDAATSQTIGITIEPAGGSAQPTTAPIMAARCIGAAACTT